MRQRQPEPELERLRRELWRRYRYMVLWVLGFPIIVFAPVVLLIVTGHIHRGDHVDHRHCRRVDARLVSTSPSALATL